MIGEDDFRAAEFVLGTLDATERAAFEQDMARQSHLRALVSDWESRLAPLARQSRDVVPPAALWARIGAALDVAGAVAGGVIDLERLRASRARWKRAAMGLAALAASLVIYIAGAPLLDHTAGTYLAVVDRGGDLPALIVKVDTRAGSVRVQAVAAEFPPDRSLELWLIEGAQAPRSLGTMEGGLSNLILPAVARSDDLAGSTLAVSIEPRGGSRTGAPTGPVVYTGKLVRQ